MAAHASSSTGVCVAGRECATCLQRNFQCKGILKEFKSARMVLLPETGSTSVLSAPDEVPVPQQIKARPIFQKQQPNAFKGLVRAERVHENVACHLLDNDTTSPIKHANTLNIAPKIIS